MINDCLARVKATFKRQISSINPTPLVRTVDINNISHSPP